MEVLRNLWRRKPRTILTISGIVMGIFALTIMGSMAEHFSFLLQGGERTTASECRGAAPPALSAIVGCGSRTALPAPWAGTRRSSIAPPARPPGR